MKDEGSGPLPTNQPSHAPEVDSPGVRRLILDRFRRSLTDWWHLLSDAADATLFPSRCPVCDVTTLGFPICTECQTQLLGSAAVVCPRCAMPVGAYGRVSDGCSECRGRSLGYDQAIALGPYESSLRDLCLKMKAERNAWLAHWLARLLVHTRRTAIEAVLQEGWRESTSVVGIPEHWSRLLSKSLYNQADTLAEQVGAILKLPVKRELRRIKPTRKLADLSRTERFREVRGAFRAKPGGVKDRQVLLVDDILTSGATCGAAARALKKAGAKRVVVLVIGRAEG